MQDLDVFFVTLIFLFLVATAGVGLMVGAARRNHPPSQNSRLAWHLLLTLYFGLATFLVAECYYRFFMDETDAFAINRMTTRWMQRHYQLNNFGTRDNRDYRLKTDQRRRITFIGDSFTAGHGIKAVDDRFANLVRSALPAHEIHTLARNGHEANDYLPRIRNLQAQGYEFDLVVLVYNLNDISYLVPERASIYASVADLIDRQSWLTRNSYFVNTMICRWKASKNPQLANYYGFVTSAYGDERWKEQCQVLSSINDEIVAAGGQMVAVTFPFLSDLSEHYAFLTAHRQLEEFWQEVGVPHLDLGPSFYGRSERAMTVNRFDPHPSKAAHAVAAEQILIFLQSQL